MIWKAQEAQGMAQGLWDGLAWGNGMAWEQGFRGMGKDRGNSLWGQGQWIRGQCQCFLRPFKAF